MAIIDVGQAAQSLVLHPVDIKEMLSVTQLQGGRRRVRINSSSIGIIQECLRKAKYSLLDQWKAQNEAPATLFGKAIHSALEVFYSGDLDQRLLPKLETLEKMSYGHKEEGEENDLLLTATRAFIDKAQPLAALPESDKRSIQNGVWLLHEYFKKFMDTPYTAYRDADGIFTERTFTLPYISTPTFDIELFGTIDFVFKHTLTGELLPGDHKTSSALSYGDSSYFDRDRPNHQYTIYSMAANRIFGIKSENFLVSVFEVKAKPKRATTPGPSFPQQLTRRTEEDYAEVEEVILESVERYLYAIDHDRFPMGSVEACNKYGGCQFKQVCAASKLMRQTILENKFNKGS